jgi:chaperonin GroES
MKEGKIKTTSTTANVHFYEQVGVPVFNTSKLRTTINYTPIAGGVVVEHILADRTEAGVILPDSQRKRNNIVRVLAIGPDVKQIKVDDLVYLSARALPIIELPLGEYLQTSEYDILGVVHE